MGQITKTVIAQAKILRIGVDEHVSSFNLSSLSTKNKSLTLTTRGKDGADTTSEVKSALEERSALQGRVKHLTGKEKSEMKEIIKTLEFLKRAVPLHSSARVRSASAGGRVTDRSFRGINQDYHDHREKMLRAQFAAAHPTGRASAPPSTTGVPPPRPPSMPPPMNTSMQKPIPPPMPPLTAPPPSKPAADSAAPGRSNPTSSLQATPPPLKAEVTAPSEHPVASFNAPIANGIMRMLPKNRTSPLDLDALEAQLKKLQPIKMLGYTETCKTILKDANELCLNMLYWATDSDPTMIKTTQFKEGLNRLDAFVTENKALIETMGLGDMYSKILQFGQKQK